MSLIDRLKEKSSIEGTNILSESEFIHNRDCVPTSIPILNIALGGDPISGGIMPGITILAGERATYKTNIALHMVKAYMNQYEDSVCLFYDSEFGSSLSYFKNMNIDMNRVLHLPVMNIEELKFDMSKKLDEIKRNDKVIILVDSIGMLASKKEIDDAKDEKSVADMTRAKALRSLFRIITPHMVAKNMPCVVIAHTYQTMDMFSKAIVSGGTAPMYACNEAFIITKSKNRTPDNKELEGFNFTLKVEKSRTIKEESKFPLSISFDSGIEPHSGLFELALECGIITSPSKGWYIVEGENKKLRRDDIEQDNELWEGILGSSSFRKFINQKYKLIRT